MDAFRIEWKSSAVRELKRMDRGVVARIVSTVESLPSDPVPAGARKLQGSQYVYRVRVGDYRVIYELVESDLLLRIVRVRHRKDAYRK